MLNRGFPRDKHFIYSLYSIKRMLPLSPFVYAPLLPERRSNRSRLHVN